MNKHKLKYSKGFTVVELMVTLVIAVLFVISGYQLYGTVSLRSSATRQAAEASNIAYDVLRHEGSVYVPATNNCNSVGTEETVSRPSTASLPNLNIKLQRCKPYADSSLIRAMVIVRYGETGLTDEVRHATYVAS